MLEKVRPLSNVPACFSRAPPPPGCTVRLCPGTESPGPHGQEPRLPGRWPAGGSTGQPTRPPAPVIFEPGETLLLSVFRWQVHCRLAPGFLF